MSKEKWSALPEVEDATGGEIIIGDLGLPYGMDHDRLQLNTDALRRSVIGWGGYSALVLGSYSGERDITSADVSGVNDDGSVTGVKASKADPAESASTNSESEKWLEHFKIRNGTLHVRVNSTALNDRATLEQQFDPAFKAKQIDAAIRRPVFKGIIKSNIHDQFRASAGVFALGDGIFLTTILTASVYDRPQAIAWVSSFQVTLTKVILPSFNRVFRGVPFQDTVTDPFFLSARPSRVVMGAGILASQRLVRATPVEHAESE